MDGRRGSNHHPARIARAVCRGRGRVSRSPRLLGQRSYALDVGAQLAHGALRFAVMGERVRPRRRRHRGRHCRFVAVVADDAAGVLGFSTSRTIFHRAIDGPPSPAPTPPTRSCAELVQGMVDGGGGVFEAITLGIHRCHGGLRW
ncbi:MAG: hypothetical protein R2710_05615 [Acidimicrobiales bacterium]